MIEIFKIQKMNDLDVVEKSLLRAKKNNRRFATYKWISFQRQLLILSFCPGKPCKCKLPVTAYDYFLITEDFAKAFWKEPRTKGRPKNWRFHYEKLRDWPNPLRYLEWCLDPSQPIRYK